MERFRNNGLGITMAEIKKGHLLLIAGFNSTYDDGDILLALNNRRIKHVHASHICWPRVNGKKVGGMVGTGFPLLEMMLENTKQFKFQRVGVSTVERLDMFTKEVSVISNVPNAEGESMDVRAFILRRKAGGKLPIFGADGSEMWFGGIDLTNVDKIDKLWKEIEKMTPYLAEDHTNWTFTDAELMEFLAIDVEDFDDEVASSLCEQDIVIDIDLKTKMDKKRKKGVKWKDLPGIDEAKVLDKQLKYDARGVQYILDDIVKIK